MKYGFSLHHKYGLSARHKHPHTKSQARRPARTATEQEPNTSGFRIRARAAEERRRAGMTSPMLARNGVRDAERAQVACES